jgi:hypothetical protein
MRSCLVEVNAENFDRSYLNKLTRCVQHIRHKRFPAAPKDLIELHIAVDQLDSVTEQNEQFILENNIPLHTVIITCDSNLRVLCRQDAEIFADGTFKCCVNLFHQLYVIHACINEHYLPLVFFLLTGKSEQLYTHMWQTLRDRCIALGLIFQPISISFDFETAAINALRTVFSKCFGSLLSSDLVC